MFELRDKSWVEGVAEEREGAFLFESFEFDDSRFGKVQLPYLVAEPGFGQHVGSRIDMRLRKKGEKDFENIERMSPSWIFLLDR